MVSQGTTPEHAVRSSGEEGEHTASPLVLGIGVRWSSAQLPPARTQSWARTCDYPSADWFRWSYTQNKKKCKPTFGNWEISHKKPDFQLLLKTNTGEE